MGKSMGKTAKPAVLNYRTLQLVMQQWTDYCHLSSTQHSSTQLNTTEVNSSQLSTAQLRLVLQGGKKEGEARGGGEAAEERSGGAPG